MNDRKAVIQENVTAIADQIKEAGGLIELEDHAIIDKKQLETLMSQNEERMKDILTLREIIMNFCGVFGITTEDGKNIKPEILSGKKSPLKGLMKGGKRIFGLIMQSAVNSQAEKELNETFSFLDKAAPIIEKYKP